LNFFLDFFKGIAIGAGAILPGISSGVLCVVFGIYETLLNCVLNFFKNIKYNFKLLFPIGLGAFVGIVLFGNILKYIFYAYPIQTKSIFVGLIIGSIPELLKETHSKTHFRLHYLAYLGITFCIGIFLVYIEKKYSFSNNASHFSFIYLIFSGFLMSAGVIIPGVSSTLILMLLGVYDAYILSISSLYISFLFPLAIGLVLGSICCIKLIKLLLDKFHAQTFYSIIGFTIGSIFVLYPRLSSINDIILCVLCILFGILIVYFPLNEKA